MSAIRVTWYSDRYRMTPGRRVACRTQSPSCTASTVSPSNICRYRVNGGFELTGGTGSRSVPRKNATLTQRVVQLNAMNQPPVCPLSGVVHFTAFCTPASVTVMIRSNAIPTPCFQSGSAAIQACTGPSPSPLAICGLPPVSSFGSFPDNNRHPTSFKPCPGPAGRTPFPSRPICCMRHPSVT